MAGKKDGGQLETLGGEKPRVKNRRSKTRASTVFFSTKGWLLWELCRERSQKGGNPTPTAECKSMFKYSITQISAFGLQKLLLTTHSKTSGGLSNFNEGEIRWGKKKAASKTSPMWVSMVRQALLTQQKKGPRALERVSGGCLHLIQTEEHRAVCTFNGIHPCAPLLQDRFPQSDAAAQFHKSVSAQPFVHLCDTSLSPLPAFWEPSSIALGFGGRGLKKEPLPCLPQRAWMLNCICCGFTGNPLTFACMWSTKN